MPETIKSGQRLTHLAHALVDSVIATGDVVVDATAGNGHDTVFLRERVGSAGRVYAVDVQESALEQAGTRVQTAFDGQSHNVTFVQACHSRIDALLPEKERGLVAGIMFNLGYLPGSDHALTTRPDTTLAALTGALRLLRPGGILSVLVYTGHPGGLDELSVVQTLAMQSSENGIEWRHYVSGQTSEKAPQLFVAYRHLPGFDAD